MLDGGSTRRSGGGGGGGGGGNEVMDKQTKKGQEYISKQNYRYMDTKLVAYP